MWRIYALREPVERNPQQPIRYIGCTKWSLQARLSRHIADSRREGRWFIKRHCAHWIRLLVRLNLKPTIEEIESGTEGTGWDRERYWIAHHRQIGTDLVNHKPGGEGLHQRQIPPEEVRLKLSAELKRIWQIPDQRRRRMAGITNPQVIARRNVSIKQAYTRPEVIERGIKHLLTPETQANRLAAYRQAQLEGRVKRKPLYTEDQMQAAITGYLAKEGCYRCMAETHNVVPGALLKRLIEMGINTSSGKGHPCKMQRSLYHTQKE